MKPTGLVLAAFLTFWAPFSGRAESAGAAQNTFIVSATFQSGAQINGTVIVDQQTGSIISADIKTSGDGSIEFNRVLYQQSIGYAYVFCLAPANASYPITIIGERDSPQSLIGYTGGPMGPRTDIRFADGTADGIVSGTLKLISGPKTNL
jgi:hypothetical protein